MSHKLGFKAKKGRELVCGFVVSFFKDSFKEKAKGTNIPVSEAELVVQHGSLYCGISSLDCTKRRQVAHQTEKIQSISQGLVLVCGFCGILFVSFQALHHLEGSILHCRVSLSKSWKSDFQIGIDFSWIWTKSAMLLKLKGWSGCCCKVTLSLLPAAAACYWSYAGW